MQEEITGKAVALIVDGTKMSEQMLEKALQKFLEAQKNKSPKMHRGKQTLKQLAGQNAGLANIEISDRNIKAFTHVAKKYHVDFALKKDTTAEQPRYLVFFKSRDADAITAAFQEFAGRRMGREEKPAIRDRLEQAVWNLLSNALKFTPAGGRVTVSLRFERKQVLLTVTDTGGGIPVERMETVFDGYLHPERLAALPCGLGLGLPLCRRIAEGHGGRLVLDSRPDQGTSVTLALPDEMAADTVEDVQFDYAGGFQPALVGLADALPYQAFLQKHSDD